MGIEICQTHPVCIKVGGKFVPRDTNESSQKELQYQLGRTFALIRPELALAQRLPEYSDSAAVLFQALPYVLTLIAVAGVIGRSIPPAADGRPYQKQ